MEQGMDKGSALAFFIVGPAFFEDSVNEDASLFHRRLRPFELADNP